MAKIILTNHAIFRFMERGIDVSEVKKAIKNATRTEAGPGGTIKVRANSAKGKVLIVVYLQSPNKIIVKTAYYEN